MFFGSVTARKVLAILLPILLLHDVLYSIVIGVSFVDIAVPISIDVCAWLVILAILWNGKDRHPATDAQRV